MLLEAVAKTHGPAFIAPITTKVGKVIASSPHPMSSDRRQNQRRAHILCQTDPGTRKNIPRAGRASSAT